MEWQAIEEIRSVIECVVRIWVGTTRSVVGSLRGRILTLEYLTLVVASFYCCRLGLRILRLGLLPGGGHFRLLRKFRDQLRRGFWIWGGVVVGFKTRASRTT